MKLLLTITLITNIMLSPYTTVSASETNSDCLPYQQIINSSTDFFVEVDSSCNYENTIDPSFIYGTEIYNDQIEPLFVGTAFLATGSAIALATILASVYVFDSNNTFVNTVYSTFNRLSENAKNNLANLFSTGSTTFDSDLLSEIHNAFDSSGRNKFTNVLGFQNGEFMRDNQFYTFENVEFMKYSGDYYRFKSGRYLPVSEYVIDLNGAEVVAKLRNSFSNPKDFSTTYNMLIRGLGDGLPTIMNLGYATLESTFNSFYTVIRYLSPDGSLVNVGTSSIFYDLYLDGVILDSATYESLMYPPPVLNVPSGFWEDTTSVSVPFFPTSILDLINTNSQTGALTDVKVPTLTNTQTGTIVNGTVKPPITSLPDDGFDGFNFAIDFSPLYKVGEKFLNVFPFSLIKDFMKVLDTLDSEPVAPYFEIPVMGSPLVIDLSIFNQWASLMRSLGTLLYGGLLSYYLFKKISL